MNLSNLLLYSYIGYSVLFAFYVQLSVGNVWYRLDASGKKSIQPWQLIKYILNPLKSRVLWHPSVIDTNYFVFVGTGMFMSLSAYGVSSYMS